MSLDQAVDMLKLVHRIEALEAALREATRILGTQGMKCEWEWERIKVLEARIEALEAVCKRDRFADGYAAGRKDFQAVGGKRIQALEAALREPVAYRVYCTNNGATGYLYTEVLPFDPGPGVKVRREPEPLFARAALDKDASK